MRRKNVVLAVAVVAGLLAASSLSGCRKSATSQPTSAPADFIEASLSVRCVPNDSISTQFLLNLDLRYRVSGDMVVGEPRHRLDIEVRDSENRVVPPAVLRPSWAWSRQFLGRAGIFGEGRTSTPLSMRLRSESTVVDGVTVIYGSHTVDIMSKAWDLKPGPYTIHGRIFLAPPESATGTGSPDDANNAELHYWDCDVTLPPVQIEVTPKTSIQPPTSATVTSEPAST